MPDYIQIGIQVLFVGINPGLRSAMVGHHFAGYSNRFWKLLCGAKLVPFPLTYEDDWRLPEWGFGLTNIVARCSSGSQALGQQEYTKGKIQLLRKIRRYQPQIVALLGVTLYTQLFPKNSNKLPGRETKSRKMRLGLQEQKLGGAKIFLLPNPSGRNAHYSYEEMLHAFRELKRVIQSMY